MLLPVTNMTVAKPSVKAMPNGSQARVDSIHASLGCALATEAHVRRMFARRRRTTFMLGALYGD